MHVLLSNAQAEPGKNFSQPRTNFFWGLCIIHFLPSPRKVHCFQIPRFLTLALPHQSCVISAMPMPCHSIRPAIPLENSSFLQAVVRETGTDSPPGSSAKRRAAAGVAGEDGRSWDHWALSLGSTSATSSWTEVINVMDLCPCQKRPNVCPIVFVLWMGPGLYVWYEESIPNHTWRI